MNETKICSRCKIPKLLSCFSKYRKAKSGLSWLCKSCDSAKRRLWELRNPDKARNKTRRTRWKKAGIVYTDLQYNNQLIAQDFKCAICNLPQSSVKRRFDVDHDHKTGKIRGLLCASCNLTVVHAVEFYDNLIDKARKYIYGN